MTTTAIAAASMSWEQSEPGSYVVTVPPGTRFVVIESLSGAGGAGGEDCGGDAGSFLMDLPVHFPATRPMPETILVQVGRGGNNWRPDGGDSSVDVPTIGLFKVYGGRRGGNTTMPLRRGDDVISWGAGGGAGLCGGHGHVSLRFEQ